MVLDILGVNKKIFNPMATFHPSKYWGCAVLPYGLDAYKQLKNENPK